MPSEPSTNETSPLLSHTTPDQNDRSLSPTIPPGKRQTSLNYRVAAAMYSFVVLGGFSSSTGMLLGALLHDYHGPLYRISLIALVGPLGYFIATFSNSIFHARFGQMGVATMGPLFHLLSAVMLSVHPPFPVALLAFAFTGVGTGLLDGSWCAWAAGERRANTISGLLQGSYSVGAAGVPFLISLARDTGGWDWWEWYYVLTGASLLELVALVTAFRSPSISAHPSENLDLYQDDQPSEPVDTTPFPAYSYTKGLKEIVRHRATWIAATYFLSYVGTETTLNFWVAFFLSLHTGKPALPSFNLALTAFWAGMSIGRLGLGPLTDYIGVGVVTAGYLVCGLVIEIPFALMRGPVVTLVLMLLLGVVMGPLFPSGVVLLTRHLEKKLHVQAVSLLAAVGQVGAGVLPYIAGLLMEAVGIEVFPWVLMVFSGVTLVVWGTFAGLGCESVEGREGLEREA